MKALWYSAIVCLLVVMTGTAQERLSGSLTVYSGERLMQTDDYQLTPGRGIVDRISATGAGGNQKIDVGFTNGGSYVKEIDGVVEFHASIDKGFVYFYEKEAMIGALPLEAHGMFFDPTVMGHYAAIMDRARDEKSGSTSFNVVVPSIQEYCPVEVRKHGTDALALDGKSLSLTHYIVVLAKKEPVSVWMDGTALIAVSMPGKNLLALEKKYASYQKELKRIATKTLL